MGRIIRTIKRVLSAICADQVLSDDIFLILLAESKSIVNSRPFTPVAMDPEGSQPPTPNRLSILCSGDHSIGVFDRQDKMYQKTNFV